MDQRASANRERPDGREARCRKAHLVSGLQLFLGFRRLHLPQTTEAYAARDELLAFEIRAHASHDEFSAPARTGAHDDLVVALGLACLTRPQRMLSFRA